MRNKSNIHWIASSVLFVVLTAITLVKCRLFATMTVEWLAGWYKFSVEGRWMALIAASLVMGSVVWLSRRPWTTIILVVISDLWIFANWIYFQANHLLLTFSAITMGSNMDGFWSSVLAYLSPQMIWIPALTCVYVILAACLRSTQRHPWVFGGTLLVAAILSVMSSRLRCQYVGAADQFIENRPVTVANFNPFITPEHMLPEKWETDLKDSNYTLHHSILAYGIQVFTVGMYDYFHTIYQQKQVTLSAEEEQQTNLLLSRGEAPQDSVLSCSGNLILIIIESWESWSLETKDIHGEYILSNINRYMRNHPHLYADKVTSQVRHGNSADGQMLINTGLLPLQDGAACFLCADNTYPNLAHFYANRVNIDACSKAWNAERTSIAFDYQQHIAPEDRSWWFENLTVARAKDYLAMHRDSTCLQLITVSMHSPFDYIKDEPVYQELQLPSDMDELTANYLRSAYWMDFFMGDLLQYLENEGFFANSTVVLTGDHTFHRDDQHFCPLVIFSPSIQQNQYITEQTYQMDIYPTVLSLIGRKDYFWQGFGIDLTNPDMQRPISPQGAFMLSDKLLRMNYFMNANYFINTNYFR
ncbi:MAG: sulfatase-like hydrolase/transferase [Paludibacteraceae bacterium]|nr:sulfatase-like hydrolase/transferase [Paludibacteraceae bacterium]